MASRGGIAWLASSSGEIGRARAVLKSMTQAGVLDELGFLVLQGMFADRLYPATNTIMTRARYLVFVPAIYRYLEASGGIRGGDGDRVDGRARALQFELRNVLMANEKLGVIGVDAGLDIARPPSNVYWSALAELGIATQRVAETTYQGRIAKGLVRQKAVRDDDEAVHPDEVESLWDGDFRTGAVLSSDGAFPASLSFRLTRVEAKELERRYAAVRAQEGGSLVSFRQGCVST